MPGTLIDGKAESMKVKEEIKAEIDEIRAAGAPDFSPGLAIIQVGDRKDSNVYIRNKLKAAEAVGIHATHHKLPADTSQAALEATIHQLNGDPTVHGMILQLPLDTTQTIDSDAVIEQIHGSKDVDGLTLLNAGRLARNVKGDVIVPCTPNGCLRLIRSTGVTIQGANVVVVGRSHIVGGPASALLRNHNATVSTAHSRTQNLPDLCRSADILLVAIGQPLMIKADWVKPGAVVIDCGINVLEGQGEGGKNKLVGDVDYEAVKDVAGFISPVPGGVGPMTVAMLLRNTLDQAKKSLNASDVRSTESNARCTLS